MSDTYGHLFPGDQADAVVRLDEVLGEAIAQALGATGTEDVEPGISHLAKRSICAAGRTRISACGVRCSAKVMLLNRAEREKEKTRGHAPQVKTRLPGWAEAISMAQPRWSTTGRMVSSGPRRRGAML